ncbi:MAG: Pycsar system effector family protein [Homoserinimonas sp.]
MSKRDALDNAWRIHQAQLDWTSKADAKAGFAFGIDSALIATVAILVSTDRVFNRDGFWFAVLLICAVIFLVSAIVLASVGVAPRLRGRKAKREARHNYIYFGHARHWTPSRLARSLRREDLLDQLTRQITVTSDVAWRKHVMVSWSLWLTLAGGLALVGYLVVAQLTAP